MALKKLVPLDILSRYIWIEKYAWNKLSERFLGYVLAPETNFFGKNNFKISGLCSFYCLAKPENDKFMP